MYEAAAYKVLSPCRYFYVEGEYDKADSGLQYSYTLQNFKYSARR